MSTSDELYGKCVTITSVAVVTYDIRNTNEVWVSNCSPHTSDLNKLNYYIACYMDERGQPGSMLDVSSTETKRFHTSWIKNPKYVIGNNVLKSPFISPSTGGRNV